MELQLVKFQMTSKNVDQYALIYITYDNSFVNKN